MTIPSSSSSSRMRLRLLLLLSALLVVVTTSANATTNSTTNSTTTAPASGSSNGNTAAWGGCVSSSTNGNGAAAAAAVQLTKPTPVCLQVANGTDWAAGVSYVRASFEPTADVYARLHIPNSYTDLVRNAKGTIFEGRNITVGAASHTALSFLRLYYDVTKRRVYPFLTAVIAVQKGIVQGLTWDDACVFCGGFACYENTYDYNGAAQNQSSSGQATRSCSIDVADCDALIANGGNNNNSSSNPSTISTACDLTLYVVWTGSDVNGQALQSQAYRFSNFPAQQLTDRITQLVPTFGLDKTGARQLLQQQHQQQKQLLQQAEHSTTVAMQGLDL